MLTCKQADFAGKILLEGAGILRNETIDNISYFCSFHGISEVMLMDKRSYTLNMTLAELENNLPVMYFFRCSRSHIINLLKINKVILNHENSIIMDCGTRVKLSRRRKDRLAQALKNLRGSYRNN
jgi:two-component system LytT family response regulator